MTLQIWLAYVAAVLLMMSTPGPSQLLMLSNSMANGFPRSLATAAGDLSANVLQMLAAGLGLGAIILASAHAFLGVQLLGVAYLAWMGLDRIRRAGRGGVTGAARSSTGTLWLQGFVTSAANPRAVVFFAALFPQFIEPAADLWPQLAILGATYIALDGSVLSLYGAGAAWIARRLGPSARTRLDRLSGAFLIIAGVLLGLKALWR